jgi:hypothetical protein
MADLFEGFNAPAAPSATGGGDDLFGDFAPVTPGEPVPTERSYLGASLRSGAQGMVAVGAGLVAGAAEMGPGMAIPGLGPVIQAATGQEGWVAPKKALLEQFKDDPKGFEVAWNSPLYAAHRLAERKAADAAATMKQLTPGGQAIAGQSYDPWSDKPTAGVERLAGDIAQSAPSVLGSAASIALATRNPVAGAAVGGAIEGTLDATGQRQEVRRTLEAVPPEKWAASIEYQKLIKEGWHADQARRYLIEEASRQSSIETGVASALISAVGGHVLGRVVQGINAGPLARVGIGFGTEAPVETLQSAVETISGNLAERRTVEPGKDPFEGTRESMFQGFVVGGVVGGAANAALGRRQRAMEHIDNTRLLGANPDTIPDAKPLPAISQRIVEVARQHGVDPNVALMTVSMESGFVPGIVNSIGATGLFQFLPDAMQQYGVTREQLMTDPEAQIDAGIRMLADAQRVVRSATGRDPLPHEIYMAQLFGHGGVKAWLAADPDAKAIDVVSGYEKRPDVALATLTGNGFNANMTVGEVIGILQKKASAHYGRVGGGGYPVGPDLGPLRSRPMGDLDPLADSEIEADEKLPPATATELEKAAIAPEVGRPGDDQTTLANVREPTVGEVEAPPAQQTWTLPAALKAGQYRWNSFDLKFSDDLTHALYGASSKIASPAATAHLNWLTNEVGMRQEEITRLGKLVREHIRIAGRVAKESNYNVTGLNIPDLVALQSRNRISGTVNGKQVSSVDEALAAAGIRPDTMLSEESIETRQETPNPNHAIAREDRPVVFGPGAGKALRQVSLKPGEVVTAALPNDHASGAYMEQVHNTVQKLVGMFAPGARVVILHETRGDGVASYKKVADGWYVLTPRNMTRLDTKGLAGYNSTAKLQAGFSLLHEVGHLIIDHHFMDGLSEAQRLAINTLPGDGYFDEKFLGGLPAEQAKILREYNKIKAELLENPKATGEDFIKKWLSPWKVAHGIGQGTIEGGARRWANKKMGEGSSRQNAKTFAMEMHARWDTLSVHEYLAEQFARYGYKKSLLEKTDLGQSSWFAQTLERLRAAFKQAKLDKVVAPLVSFEKWLNSLAANARPVEGKRQRTPKISMAGARFDAPLDVATRDRALFAPGIPEAVRKEAVELIHYGQPETAREVIESASGKMEVTRWDGDMPEFASIDEAGRNLSKIPGVRSAASRWYATGARLWAQMGAAVTDIRQKAAVNLDVPGLIHIDNILSSYKAYSGRLQTRSDEIAKKWEHLSRNQSGRMQELMRLEWESGTHLADLQMVNGEPRFVSNAKFAEAATKAGLDERTAQLMLDVKSDYLHRTNVLHKSLRRVLMDKLANALPERRPYYQEQIRRLAQTFTAIRRQPIMPQTRFGNHFLEVKQGKRVVHVESFESPSARDDAMLKLKKATKGYTITPMDVDSRVAVMRVLPIEVLDDVGFDGVLTPRQRAALIRTVDPATANPKARKYSQELARITGASRDGLRVYADFMHNDALLLSKMAFKGEFDTGLEMIEGDLRGARASGDILKSDQLQALYDGVRADVAQILNPAAEWHALRSFIVLHDLWFSIKSAVANVTDTVKVWARVSKILGDIAGGRVFGKTAFDSAASMISDTMAHVAGGPANQWKGLNFEERQAMGRAQAEGHVDETYAATLAGMGSGGVLQRMGMNTISRKLDTLMRAGMKPMQIMEQFTRRVAFLATFRAYRIQGIPLDQAYGLAVQDLHLIGGDNSIQNRSALMRGKKGLALIYYNYMRSTLWTMTGGLAENRRQREGHDIVPPSKGFGNETARMWIAYLALGGLMGLPGAEDLDKLLEVASRQVFGQRFSLRENAYELAKLIADNAKEIGIDISPRTYVHGAATNVFGFDVSGSVSLGNALPGLGSIDNLGERDSFKALLGLIGPAGRRLEEGLNLFNESLPWDKRYALGLPVAGQNLKKAVDVALEKEPRFFSGARVLVDPRTGELKRLDTGDGLGLLMGFNPADIAARRELSFIQREFTEYWAAKRNVTLTQLWEAKLQRNQDAIHDALREVRHFNSIVPNREMALTADTIERSMSARARNMQREERAAALSRAHQPRYSELTRLVLGESR